MIELERVTKIYPMGGEEVRALAGIDLQIQSGEYVAIVGPSGSGKSTLMNILGCLDSPTSGSYRLDGEEVSRLDDDALARFRNRQVGFVFQTFNLMPRMSALKNVELPLVYGGLPPVERRERAERALALVDLTDRMHHVPNELSGGQRQRVGVARALAADPPVLLMDEPFGAVDPIVRARLQAEFRAILRGLRKTVIFVTHDVDEAIRMGDRIAILREGGVLAQYDTPDAILAHPADNFVAQFIGEDRALRRLALKTLRDATLEPGSQSEPGSRVAPDTTVRNAVSLMLESGDEQLVVVDGDQVLGVFHLRDAGDLL